MAGLAYRLSRDRFGCSGYQTYERWRSICHQINQFLFLNSWNLGSYSSSWRAQLLLDHTICLLQTNWGWYHKVSSKVNSSLIKFPEAFVFCKPHYDYQKFAPLLNGNMYIVRLQAPLSKWEFHFQSSSDGRFSLVLKPNLSQKDSTKMLFLIGKKPLKSIIENWNFTFLSVCHSINSKIY